MFFKKKTIEIPKIEGTETLEVAETWTVEWKSRHSEYSTGVKKEFEVFFNEENALKFKDALKNAWEILRNTAENTVSITNNQTKHTVIY